MESISMKKKKTPWEKAFKNKQIQLEICACFPRNVLLMLGLVSVHWRYFTSEFLCWQNFWIHLEYDQTSSHHIIRNTRLKSDQARQISLQNFNSMLQNSLSFPCQQFTINGGDLGSSEVQQFFCIFGHQVTAISIHRVTLTLSTLQLLPSQFPNLLELSITQPIISPLRNDRNLPENSSNFNDLSLSLQFQNLSVLNLDGTESFQPFHSLFSLNSLQLTGGFCLSHLHVHTRFKIIKTFKHITIQTTSSTQLESLQYLIKAGTLIHNITLVHSRKPQALQPTSTHLLQILQKNAVHVNGLHGFFVSYFSTKNIYPKVKKATILIGNESNQFFSSKKLQNVLPNVERLVLRIYFYCPNYFGAQPQIPLPSVKYLRIHGDFPQSYWQDIYRLFPNIVTLDIIFCPCGRLVKHLLFKNFKFLDCVKYSRQSSYNRSHEKVEFQDDEDMIPRGPQPELFAYRRMFWSDSPSKQGCVCIRIVHYTKFPGADSTQEMKGNYQITKHEKRGTGLIIFDEVLIHSKKRYKQKDLEITRGKISNVWRLAQQNLY